MEIAKTRINETAVKLSFGEELTDSRKDVKGTVELDIENQCRFVETIEDLILQTPVHVILDMSGIIYIDSSGLWALFEGHKKMTQKSLKMVLFNVTKDVMRVLDITKMSSKLVVCANESDAIVALT